MTRLKTDMRENRQQATNRGEERPLYIIKPSDMSQGKGIFFANDFDSI